MPHLSSHPLIYNYYSVDSGRDLLGDYDFNPFVDLDVELDYDENMEEDLDQPETQPQTDTNNGLKEDKGILCTLWGLFFCCCCFVFTS